MVPWSSWLCSETNYSAAPVGLRVRGPAAWRHKRSLWRVGSALTALWKKSSHSSREKVTSQLVGLGVKSQLLGETRATALWRRSSHSSWDWESNHSTLERLKSQLSGEAQVTAVWENSSHSPLETLRSQLSGKSQVTALWRKPKLK